jgi:hypothetical protein
MNVAEAPPYTYENSQLGDSQNEVVSEAPINTESFTSFFNQAATAGNAISSGNLNTTTPAPSLNLVGRTMEISLTEDQVQKVIDTFLPTISQTIPIKTLTMNFEGSTFTTDITVDVPYFKGTVSGNGRIVNNKLVLDNAVVGVIPLSQANREYIAQEINNALISAAGKYNLSIKSLTLSNDKLTVVLEKIS